MPTNKQCENHTWMLEQLKAAQEADHDTREEARDDQLFVEATDGQWEPEIVAQNQGRPQYTFDLVDPIVDQVAGAMEKLDFDIRITPGSGDSSKEIAQTYDGIVRHIENISNAQDTYDRAGRGMTVCGLDGWEVVQQYVDGDTFDQDLMIEKVGNWLDRVWFGPHEKPDASDSKIAWKLTGMDPEEFKVKYPDRPERGVDSDRTSNAYFHRQDMVMVGKFYYLKERPRKLVLMSNGQVYEDNDDYKRVKDELAEAGITQIRTRTRKVPVLYTRLFDTNDWIGEERETVFRNWIPLVPCYGNFDVVESKVVYRGAVRKLRDPQRVFNYSLSREIEEGALAPRIKTWMTKEQAKGYTKSLSTMNTNTDPVQFYNHVDGHQAPYQDGGAKINPGLRNISEAMQGLIGMSAGMFASNMGDNPGLQSGKAIEALQDRGDTGNNKYQRAREKAQQHTGRIIVDAIPRVYEPGRQVRLLKEDGSHDMYTIGQEVIDNETGQVVVLNELTQGSYDVTCTYGPSFKNRQSETVSALTEIGKVDQEVIALGSDILMKNINSPGMDQIAERQRKRLFDSGVIPVEQMTDEEQAQYQQMMSQPQQPDPMMVAAQAEHAKAQADMQEAKNKEAQIKIDAQDRQAQREIDGFNAETKRIEAITKAEEAGANIDLKGAQTIKAFTEARKNQLGI